MISFLFLLFQIISNTQHTSRTEQNTNKNNNNYTELSLLAKMCLVLCKLLFILLCFAVVLLLLFLLYTDPSQLCIAFPKIQIPKGHKTYNFIQLFCCILTKQTNPNGSKTEPTQPDRNQWFQILFSCLFGFVCPEDVHQKNVLCAIGLIRMNTISSKEFYFIFLLQFYLFYQLSF